MLLWSDSMARTLDRVDPNALGPLADHVGRLKHDLGKYVSLQARWLADDATGEERRKALEADLLSTRRGPDGSQEATSVWAEFRPGLIGEADLGGGARADLSDDPELRALDLNMAIVAEIADALRAKTADDEAVARGSEAARNVAETCRSLARRVRASGA